MSAIAQPAATSAARAEPRPSGWDNLKPLLPYVARYKGMVTLGLVLDALMGIVGALPQLVQGIITDCLSGLPQPLTTLAGTARRILWPLLKYYAPVNRRALGIYCLTIVGAMIIKGIFSFWTRWILIGVSREIEYDLRNDLLARLVRLDSEFYARNRTGDLMSRATNDLNAVRMVLGPGIMYTATTIATAVVSLFFMLKLSAGLTLWVLLPVPFVVLAVYYFGRIIHRLSERIQAALGVLSTRAQENLTGVRVIRAYAQEKSEIALFDQANRDYVDRNIQLISSWSLFFPALTALIGVSFVILLGAGGVRVIDRSVSIGTLWSFFTFLMMLVFPIIALGWVTNIFQRGAASMGRLSYILNADPRISDAPAVATGHGALEGRFGPEIEFRRLTFAYPTSPRDGAGPPVLQDINLQIPTGSTLAIIGPTGSGKSTLAALIARLWEAPEGTLLIGGRPIREYPLEELRQAIGYVPQDTFLFSETLAGNIAFGLKGASEEVIAEAADIACLSGDIAGFPQRYATMVGERGITLSGGQKQRTSLARAIARRPRILILDDALSNVDTETEEHILRGLREVIHGRTTILIAHRISTVKDADQIIVLRGGRITERGTHEQLLALGGYYADLYQKQLLEEELARE
ncbi:MAG TPA: ABC transporter ATP-binding protein [Candidatus Acidoferrales bacterium]|nr:ABC transporter ATP-binding protein [Candidatus Acidoferrales bacterium]